MSHDPIDRIVIRVPAARFEFDDGRVIEGPLIDLAHNLTERWRPVAARHTEATAGREPTAEETATWWQEYFAAVQAYVAEQHQVTLTYGDAVAFDRELKACIARKSMADAKAVQDLVGDASSPTQP